MYSKLNEEESLKKVAQIIQSNSSKNCVNCYNIEILNLFDSELQLINATPMIKSKLFFFLSELRKFKFHEILVLDYKKKINLISSTQVLH